MTGGLDSGETDLELLMETPGVIGECRRRIGEAMEEPVDKESEAAMTVKCSGRIDHPWPETGLVGADLGRLFQEALHESGGGRVLPGIRTEERQRLELTGPAEDGVKEEPQDRRPVLTAGQAEVRQEGHRPARAHAEEPVDHEARRGCTMGEEGLTAVRPVEPEPMAVRTEGAAPVLIGEKAPGICQVRFDSALCPAYLLQQTPRESEGGLSLGEEASRLRN